VHTFKVLTVVVILAAIIIGAGIVANGSFSSSANRLDTHIENMEKTVSDGNWSGAEESLISIQQVWSKTQDLWAALLDHAEMDNIDATLARLEKYMKSRDKALTLGEASLLKLYVKHIPEKEKFNISNVL
jgi:predicted PurR-regulated permease PerM